MSDLGECTLASQVPTIIIIGYLEPLGPYIVGTWVVRGSVGLRIFIRSTLGALKARVKLNLDPGVWGLGVFWGYAGFAKQLAWRSRN